MLVCAVFLLFVSSVWSECNPCKECLKRCFLPDYAWNNTVPNRYYGTTLQNDQCLPYNKTSDDQSPPNATNVEVKRAILKPDAPTPPPGLFPPLSDLDETALRRNAKQLFWFDCVKEEVNVGANYYVDDQNSKDQRVPSFRLLFFRNQADVDLYKTDPSIPPNLLRVPFAFDMQTNSSVPQYCIDQMYHSDNIGAYSDTRGIVVVAECIRWDADCNLTFYFVTQCWTSNTNDTAIPGLVLCILLLLAVFFVVIYRRLNKMPLSAEITVPLICLGVIALLQIIYWAIAIADNGTNSETVALSSKYQWVMFWIDKALMLVSVSTFAFILAYWVAALSPSKATLAHTGFYISFAVWVALSVALLVPYRVLINESQSTSKLHNLLKAFLGTAYFLHLIVAVFLVIVGVKLASHAQSSGKLDADSKKGVIRLYFLLGVIALVSVVRVGVALYYSLIWVAAVGPDALLWPTYNLITFRYPSTGHGVTNSVLVVLLPNVIPALALLFILLFSGKPSEATEYKLDEPLIEKYRSSKRYEI